MKGTENTCRQLKIGTYDYLDGILYSFQGKMSQLSELYFGDMFSNLEKAFKDINEALESNREELKDMAYRAQMDESPEFRSDEPEEEEEKAEPQIGDDDKVEWQKN